MSETESEFKKELAEFSYHLGWVCGYLHKVLADRERVDRWKKKGITDTELEVIKAACMLLSRHLGVN